MICGTASRLVRQCCSGRVGASVCQIWIPAACCPMELRKETDMDDMIGASGILRGGAMFWPMYLLWLLVMVLVSVAATAVIQSLFATLRPHLVVPKFLVNHAALEVQIRVERR